MLITESVKYVVSDQYFLLSMGVISSIGIFIGSVVYDGVLKEVKKAMVVLFSYASLLVMNNLSRILPIITNVPEKYSSQPLAGSVTIAFVTLFYILGMLLGVKITHLAHGNKES